MITDPIADLLTRIRNANQVNKQLVELPYSAMKENVLKVFKQSGFVGEVKVFKDKDVKHKMLSVELIYIDGEPRIQHIERVSKPGLRVYTGYRDLQKVLGGFGTYIISTPKGIINSVEAEKKKLGGEIICKIW